jgi:hypothetical protein
MSELHSKFSDQKLKKLNIGLGRGGLHYDMRCKIKIKIGLQVFIWRSIIQISFDIKTDFRPSNERSFLSEFELRARIFKLFRGPRIVSNESILPANVAWRTGTTTLFFLSRKSRIFFYFNSFRTGSVLWRPMRPKARGMAQHDGPPGWLEESGPAGCDCVVMDGPCRLP